MEIFDQVTVGGAVIAVGIFEHAQRPLREPVCRCRDGVGSGARGS